MSDFGWSFQTFVVSYFGYLWFFVQSSFNSSTSFTKQEALLGGVAFSHRHQHLFRSKTDLNLMTVAVDQEQNSPDTHCRQQSSVDRTNNVVVVGSCWQGRRGEDSTVANSGQSETGSNRNNELDNLGPATPRIVSEFLRRLSKRNPGRQQPPTERPEVLKKDATFAGFEDRRGSGKTRTFEAERRQLTSASKRHHSDVDNQLASRVVPEIHSVQRFSCGDVTSTSGFRRPLISVSDLPTGSRVTSGNASYKT